MKKETLSLISCLLGSSLFLTAAPDTVDSAFASTAGQVFDASDFGGISSVLVQPDGKVLFGSNEMSAYGGTKQISLIRFNPDGSVDTDFFSDDEPNGAGLGIYYTGQGWPEVHALGMQSDGKVIAAGALQGMNDGTNNFTSNSIVRINPNGTVDPSFQTSGTRGWPVGGFNYIEDVTVAPDDKIYCVGGFGGFYGPGFSGPTTQYGIARLNADGSLDTTFQINPADFGVPPGASNVRGFFNQASLDSSGDIYVVGFFEWGPLFPNAGSTRFLARLNPNGSRDYSFTPALPANIDRVTGVVVEPSGSVTVLGSIGNPETESYMARFTATGAPDNSFSFAGGLGVIDARPLQRDPNGKYLVARASSAGNYRDNLIRLNNNGSVDPTFDAISTYQSEPNKNPSFNTYTTGADGRIYSGSFFDHVQGVPTVKVVAFEGDAVPNAPGSIQFAAFGFSINEEDGSITIPVTRTGGSTGAASASFSMTDINATAGADYTAVTTTVNFPAGVAGTQYVTIPITTDGTPETAEVVTLNLTGITGASAGATTSANLVIIDSDSPPEIILQPTAIYVPPFDAFQLVVGALSGASPLTFQWKKDNVDIPGATSPLYLVTEANAASHDGSYTVVVTNPNGSVTSLPVDVVVKDPAELSFTATNFEALESDGTATLTLSRNGSAVGPVSVDVSLTGGDATSGSDFSYTTQTVSWADGETADKTVTITLSDDPDLEDLETAIFTLTNYSPDAIAGATTTATLDILDDDSPATIITPVAAKRAVVGWSTFLSVEVESQSPVTYQWLKNGTLIPGATDAILTIDPVESSDFGLYSVEITNSAGTLTSGPAELGERPSPIGLQPILGSKGSGIIYDPISRAAGGYYIPGSFQSWNGPDGVIAAQRLVRILADGTPDPTFTPGINGGVNIAIELSDESILIRGSFSAVDGTPAAGFAKLLPDGSLDTDFMTTIGSSYPNVSGMFEDKNGRILLTYNGDDNLARLSPDGTADPTFDANVAAIFSSSNFRIIQDAPSGYYVSGTLNLLNLPAGQTRKNFIRLNPDGTLDNTLTPVGGNFYFDVQSDGRVVALNSGVIRRLELDGTIDPTFSEITMVINNAFAVAADDSLYVSTLDTTNGSVYELRHFNPDGTRDTGFNGGNPLITTSTLAQYSDITGVHKLKNGQLHIDGSFLTFNGDTVTTRPVIIDGELESIEITEQPSLTIADPGDEVILQVVASSAFPLSYQWRKNGDDIPGATFPILELSNVSTADHAEYTLAIDSSAGSVVSDPIPLIVRDAPMILSEPEGSTLIIGSELSLTVDFVALDPATVQWFKTGVGPLPGETNPTLTIDPVSASDSGRYYATITNSLGAVTTTEVIVQIIADPAGLVAGFIPATGGSSGVSDIAVDSNGGALLTGSYFALTHPTNNGQANFNRVNADGAPDPTFTGSSNQSISETAFDGTDGFILTGSRFFLNGSGSRYLERVGSDGLTDAAFATNRGNFTIFSRALAVDAAGRIYRSGSNEISRFAADGTPDNTYNPAITGTVTDLTFDGSGRLYALTGSRIVRFLSDGSTDVTFTFDPSISATGLAYMGLAEDGSLAVADLFERNIRIINPDGSLRRAFEVPGIGFGNISALAVQANGKILVAFGQGTRLTRLLPDGTADPMFDVGTGFNSNINDIDVHTDGTIWVGGAFNQYNGTTAFGYLRLNGDPLDLNINTQPSGQIVDIGDDATFSVVATTLGAEPISYQWQKNGNPLSNGGDISGADTDTLTIANTDLTDEADYEVIITNLTTGTEKTTLAASLTVLEAPEILVELEPTFDLEVGDALNLEISARGAGTLTYQWQKDQVDIPGETGSSLTIDPLAVENSGSYRVVITNNYDSITSGATAVTVVLSPAAIAQDFNNLDFGGTVRAILPLPDGRTLVGGQFSSIRENGNYYAIDEVALLNADGTLDTDFDLTPNSSVYSLTLDNDGGVLIGGRFTFIGGQSCSRIARLSPDLTIDESFNTSNGANNDVWDIAVDPNGKIIIGGQFTEFAGDSSADYLCRLNRDGSLDTTFTTTGLAVVYQVVPTADGKVVAGGAFNISGNRHIARFNNDGSHDTSFTANTGNLRYPYALIQMPDGGWLAGTNYGVLYRYDANGTQDSSLSFSADSSIWSLAIEDDGQILVGGQFTSFDGTNQNRLTRLNPDGSIDPTFTIGAGANSTVYAIAVRPLGGIWIGGQFSSYRDTLSDHLTLLNGDPLDLAISQNPGNAVVEPGETATFTVNTAATDTVSYQWQRNGNDLSDGGDTSGATTDTLSIANVENADADNYRVIVTHNTTAETLTSTTAELIVLGAPEILTHPLAVTTEAGLGASFLVNVQGVSPLTFQWFRNGAPLTDDANIAGATTAELTLSGLTVADSGSITVRVTNSLGFIDSTPTALLVQKLPAGIARDINLPLSVNSTINDVLPLDDGSYLIGGAFTSISYSGGSSSRRYLAKFSADGTADLTFPQVSGSGNVFAIERAPDGKIYVGGSFSTLNFNGNFVSSTRIVRINPDGSHDDTFNVGGGPNNNVQTILPLSNGKVLIGGRFNSIAGQAGTAYIALLNENGSVDTSFTSLATTTVNDIAADGTGGYWLSHANSYDGQNRIVRIDGTGAKATGFSYSGTMSSVRVLGNPDGSAYSLSTSFPFIQRIEPNGDFNNGWPATGTSTPNNDVEAGLLLPDGKIVIGGDFVNYNSTSRNRIAILESDGSLNTDFDPLTGLNGPTSRIRTDAAGRLWVVGAITTYQGETIPRMVVLNGFDPSGESPLTTYLTNAGVPEIDQAPGNDYDLDGWSNLFEFLYGSDPTDPSGGIGVYWNPTTSTLPGNSINTTLPGAGLDPAKRYRTTYVRTPIDKKGLSVSLEAGTDLTDFGTGSAQAFPLGAPTPDGTGYEIQIYYLTPSMDDQSRLFWRLKVEE